MPIELRKGRGGKPRTMWYGRYEANGKRYTINLGIKIAGTPPASLSLRDQGDVAFEKSRAVAKAKLDAIIDESRFTQDSVHLVERLYEMKTGSHIKSIDLDIVSDAWLKIPRKRQPSERYASQCTSTLNRFVEFVHENYASVHDLGAITPEILRDFLDSEKGRGISAKTWNDTLKLLRATFKYLLSKGSLNPAENIPTRDTETIFRKPFTPDELQAILEVAKGDDFIRPIIITGMCTAMRRGDCCLLKWDDVDLNKRFLAVKTSKTGQTVDIPIFPLLMGELSRFKRNPNQLHVFPEQAIMYQNNPDGITWRVKKVLEAAFCPSSVDTDLLPELGQDVLRERAERFFDGLPPNEKTERMRQALALYMDGKSLNQVVKESGMCKGSVSGYLKEIEAGCGCRVLRWKKAAHQSNEGILQKKREHGLRDASIRDFHSFRVTWVTLALTAGVPLELVQKVTGHKTVDVVLKHYFQPGREDFRDALQQAMPALFGESVMLPAASLPAVSVHEEMRNIIENMTGRSLKNDRVRLLELLETV